VQQVRVFDVVQVQGDGHSGHVGDCGRGGADRQHVAVVEPYGVLGDLQDHRPGGGLGPGDDRLGVLEGVTLNAATPPPRRRASSTTCRVGTRAMAAAPRWTGDR